MLRLRSYLADHRPAAIVTWLGLFYLLFYLAGARGTMSFGDDKSMLAVTRSIATHGSVAVPPGTPRVNMAKDGRYYSKYGLGESVLAVPFYFVCAYVLDSAKPDSYPNPSADPITYAVCLVGIFSGVGAVVVLYLSCVELGFGDRASIIAAIAFGACTFEWFYARTFMSEVPSTFFLICAFYALLRWREENSTRWLWCAGISSGLSVFVRLQNVIMLPALGIWLLCELWLWNRYELKKRVASMVIWSAPIFASLLVIAAYNYTRFGSVTDVGIGRPIQRIVLRTDMYLGFYVLRPDDLSLPRFAPHGTYSTPLYVGLYGFLLSPGKSIFWYAPILIPAVYGWRFLWRKWPRITGMLCILVGSNLILYSKYVWWYGGGAWGPRHMVQILPFLMIGLAALIDHGLELFGKIEVGAAAALRLLLQAPSILISYIPYEGLMEQTTQSFNRLLWNPAYSPIIVQSGYLIRHQYQFDLAYNAYTAPDMANFQLVALIASLFVLGIGASLFFDGKQLELN